MLHVTSIYSYYTTKLPRRRNRLETEYFSARSLYTHKSEMNSVLFIKYQSAKIVVNSTKDGNLFNYRVFIIPFSDKHSTLHKHINMCGDAIPFNSVINQLTTNPWPQIYFYIKKLFSTSC